MSHSSHPGATRALDDLHRLDSYSTPLAVAYLETIVPRQQKLRLEWRDELHARQLGTFSLAGAQDKTSATGTRWPWCVCDGCGAASRGKRPGEEPG